jgi:hypothetical protein
MRQLIIIYEFKPENLHKQIPFMEGIRKYGRFAFVSNNACIIWTDETAAMVRDNLKVGLGIGDKLYVGGTSAPAAWLTSIGQEVTDYLQKNLQ